MYSYAHYDKSAYIYIVIVNSGEYTARSRDTTVSNPTLKHLALHHVCHHGTVMYVQTHAHGFVE